MKEINTEQSGLVLTKNIVFFNDYGWDFYMGTKRILDIIVAIFGIFCALPVAIIVAFMIKIEDGGPVIYRQNRIGRDGVRFKLYKFRSMRVGADEFLKVLLRSNPELASEYSKNAKLKDDPRITRVGKFIRKTSLDELPQLLNILKGDMSLVGPRPYMVEEKKKMGEYFGNIVRMRPGLTGFWQVTERSNATFDRRLELESYYSENASLKLDFQIFLKTFETVLDCKGAM